MKKDGKPTSKLDSISSFKKKHENDNEGVPRHHLRGIDKRRDGVRLRRCGSARRDPRIYRNVWRIVVRTSAVSNLYLSI